MRTLMIIPAYNEEGNILHTLQDLKDHYSQADTLVINDCSRDGTMRLLEQNSEEHVNLPVNLGIGGAVQTGYLYARQNGYEIAVQFDGDGQHRADCLQGLVQPLLTWWSEAGSCLRATRRDSSHRRPGGSGSGF